MLPINRLAIRGRRQFVIAMALGVAAFSICGLVATALATQRDLPGFETYDVESGNPPTRDVEPRLETPIPDPVETSVRPEGFDAPVQSLTIPAMRVSAPLIPMGVRDGYMDLPNNPHQVAWYDFTAKPGMGGNAVFSAHVDYINYGPAVFWNLSKLRPSDEASIQLTDGTVLGYSVTDSYTIALAQLDVRSLIAPTEVETITLITCAGAFANNDYSHRVIVRATRTSAQSGSR